LTSNFFAISCFKEIFTQFKPKTERKTERKTEMKKLIKLLLALVAIFFAVSTIFSNPININWIGGVSGPRNDSWFSSISWNDFSSNVIYATKNSMKNYDKDGQVIVLVSDISDGSTILNLMESKPSSEFTYSGKNFSGIGFFIEEINGIKNIPEDNIYWTVLVNEGETSVGVSEQVINTGDTIKFILDSVSNDEVVFEDDLGTYEKVIGTEVNQFWDGKFVNKNSYPEEKGQGWNQIVWITTDLNSTFIPKDISMTIYVERWAYGSQSWQEYSSRLVNYETVGVICQSFEFGEDGIPGTEDDEIFADNSISTKSFIFSSSGITFLPMIGQNYSNGTPERVLVNNTYDFLLDNKVRLRFVISVPFEYSNGSKGVVTEEKIVYKQLEPINNGELINFNNLITDENGLVTGVKLDLFNFDPTGLYQIEKSTDLKKWYPFGWKYGSGILEQDVEGSRNFFRIKNRY